MSDVNYESDLKITLTYETTDAHSNHLKIVQKAGDFYDAIHNIYYIARDRLKHGEGVSDEEERVLERIMEEAADSGFQEIL